MPDPNTPGAPRSHDAEFDRYATSYGDLHRDSIRASGEEPAYFAEYKAAWIARRLGISGSAAGLDVLDFGCGVGGTLPHLTRHFPGATLHGADISGESIAVAKAANPSVALAQIADGCLPLEDASIDVVLAACVYHHIPPAERAHWTTEIRRVLKPGGHFFIFEHNPLNPLTRKVVRDCAFDEDAILLPRRESIGLLRDAGFSSPASAYTVFFPNALSALRPVEPALEWLPLGAQYVAYGRA